MLNIIFWLRLHVCSLECGYYLIAGFKLNRACYFAAFTCLLSKFAVCQTVLLSWRNNETGDGVSLQTYLHNWRVAWACLSSWFRVDGKDPVKSLFNRPKIISCKKWTIRVRVGVISTSERSKFWNRRPQIISCCKLTIVVLIVHFDTKIILGLLKSDLTVSLLSHLNSRT